MSERQKSLWVVYGGKLYSCPVVKETPKTFRMSGHPSPFHCYSYVKKNEDGSPVIGGRTPQEAVDAHLNEINREIGDLNTKICNLVEKHDQHQVLLEAQLEKINE